METEKLGVISSEKIAVLFLNCTLCELQMDYIFKVFCDFIETLLEEQVWAWVLVIWQTAFRFGVSEIGKACA